jgi:hypothetical protein
MFSETRVGGLHGIHETGDQVTTKRPRDVMDDGTNHKDMDIWSLLEDGHDDLGARIRG